MAYTKKAINTKYDKLRAQLKTGTIDQKTFKASANRLYDLYHKNKGKGSTAKPSATTSKPTPPKSKTGAAVLGLGGGNVKKGTLPKKPQVATTKKDMPYQGVFPGTPEAPKPKKKESNSQRNRRGRGAGVRGRKPSTKEGTTKTIQLGPKRVTMVYKGGKWVRKNG